jgi:hypothetical protein
MKSKIQINLKDEQYEELARELLNNALELNLEVNPNHQDGFDLIQNKGERQMVAVQVISPERTNARPFDQLLIQIRGQLGKYNLKKFILVCFGTPSAQQRTSFYNISNKFKTQVELFDIEWISSQLDRYPDIAEKYLAKENYQTSSGDTETQSFQIDKDYFIEKYNNILQEPDFLFDKAIEVLDQLTTFNIRPNLKDIKETPKPSPIEKLREYWDERIDLKPSDFPVYLEKKDPELVELYEMITKFITYVDTKGWNKQKLNEYDDKRAIARTGVRQNILIDHFFKYALNNFKIPTELADKAFFRAIEYLNNPEAKFNILSERHRDLISQYFLGKVFTGNNFHEMLLNIFKPLVFVAQNPKNLTFFYTRIIYDEKFRQEWSLNIEEEEEEDDDETYEVSNKLLTKASIDNDGAYTTTDLLDIENDVQSFALILAAESITPPLAIALFGKWGSGKSFFMEELYKNVEELSSYQGFKKDQNSNITTEDIKQENTFCKGIAQLRFNAWSYLDSNLWAGLISSIFERLDEYIKDSKKGDKEKLYIRSEIVNQLGTLSSERKIIISEIQNKKCNKETIEGNIIDLKGREKEIIEATSKKKFNELLNNQISNIVLPEATKEALKKYKIIDGDIKGLSPEVLNEEVKSWVSFAKILTKLSWQAIAYFLLAFILFLVVCFNPMGIINELARVFIFIIGIIGPIVIKMVTSFNQFRDITQPVTDFKNEYNAAIKKVQLDFQEAKELLILELNTINSSIQNYENMIADVDFQIKELEFNLNNLVTQKAFDNYISRQVKEGGYKDHLGLISIIRNDFEILSNLFLDNLTHKAIKEKAADNTKKEILLDDNAAKKQEVEVLEDEDISSQEEIEKGKFLDRIILYIDDLDRCSDEKVLEVIQAVHLLMAFPLFNVVVGVDKRCVRNALINKGLKQYDKFSNKEEIEKAGISMITADEYLEKIFQIPFQLKDPSEKDLKKLVNHFLKNQIIKENITISGEKPSKETELNEGKLTLNDNDKIEISILDETAKVLERKSVSPADLQITKKEFEYLKEMLWLVGKVPRTIKRFINIYRIIRAHQSLKLGSKDQHKELLAIMFILAINIGQYKNLSNRLLKAIEENGNQTLGQILDKLITTPSLVGSTFTEKETDKLVAITSEIEKRNTIDELLLFNVGTSLSNHISFVSRFSFSYEKNDIPEAIIEPTQA